MLQKCTEEAQQVQYKDPSPHSKLLPYTPKTSHTAGQESTQPNTTYYADSKLN